MQSLSGSFFFILPGFSFVHSLTQLLQRFFQQQVLFPHRIFFRNPLNWNSPLSILSFISIAGLFWVLSDE